MKQLDLPIDAMTEHIETLPERHRHLFQQRRRRNPRPCARQIKRKARIIICGAISQYNNTTAVQGPKNYLSLLVNRARMEGIVVFDYADRYGIAIAEMAGYLKDGKMKSKEDIVVGIETFPETLLKLFNGENFWKLVLQVATE